MTTPGRAWTRNPPPDRWRGHWVAVRREIGPEIQFDVREARGERERIGRVELDEPAADVFVQLERPSCRVHPASNPVGDERIEPQETVRAGKLSEGIGDAALVLQDEDLLRREVGGPPAQCVVVEASGRPRPDTPRWQGSHGRAVGGRARRGSARQGRAEGQATGPSERPERAAAEPTGDGCSPGSIRPRDGPASAGTSRGTERIRPGRTGGLRSGRRSGAPCGCPGERRHRGGRR